MGVWFPQKEGPKEPHLPFSNDVHHVVEAILVFEFPNSVISKNDCLAGHADTTFLTDRCNTLQSLPDNFHNGSAVMTGGFVHDMQLKGIPWSGPNPTLFCKKGFLVQNVQSLSLAEAPKIQRPWSFKFGLTYDARLAVARSFGSLGSLNFAWSMPSICMIITSLIGSRESCWSIQQIDLSAYCEARCFRYSTKAPSLASIVGACAMASLKWKHSSHCVNLNRQRTMKLIQLDDGLNLFQLWCPLSGTRGFEHIMVWNQKNMIRNPSSMLRCRNFKMSCHRVW